MERWEASQKIKAQLGIVSIPLVLLWNMYKLIRAAIHPRNKKDSGQDNLIMTDINVSTDFANLCMNRE